jgi:nucleotide-binding universal stress UspA family protein
VKHKKILIATDLSKSTLNVISKTLDFAKKTDSSVDIVHIVESSFFDSFDDVDSVYANTVEFLKEHFPMVQKESIHVKKGVVKDDVSKMATELGSDLIVIGSNGESSFIEEMFLGSSTKEIVRSSKIPVLVVKNIHELKYERILALSDFSEGSKGVIEEAATLFPDSHFTLYHSYTLPFESRLSVYGLDHSEAQAYQRSMLSATKENANEFIKSLKGGESKYRYVLKRDGIETQNFREALECETNDLVLIHTTGSFSFIAFDILEASKLDVLMISID